jgi:hypothetical protein
MAREIGERVAPIHLRAAHSEMALVEIAEKISSRPNGARHAGGLSILQRRSRCARRREMPAQVVGKEGSG